MNWDDDDFPKDEPKSRLPDSIRKALVGGLSAVFMTEEGIRNAVSDMRLPKDAINFLAQQTERTRRELGRMVSEEVKGFLGNIDINRALRKAIAGMRVEVRAELRFVDDATGMPVKSVKHSVRARVARDDEPPRKKKRSKARR